MTERRRRAAPGAALAALRAWDADRREAEGLRARVASLEGERSAQRIQLGLLDAALGDSEDCCRRLRIKIGRLRRKLRERDRALTRAAARLADEEIPF